MHTVILSVLPVLQIYRDILSTTYYKSCSKSCLYHNIDVQKMLELLLPGMKVPESERSQFREREFLGAERL